MLVWPQNETQQQKAALSWMWLCMLIYQDVQEAEAVECLEPKSWAPAWAKY